jgi:small-conductance mechanosensitive channel
MEEGNDTIRVSVYFWTNLSGKEYENIKMPKKTCWDSGMLNIVSNNKHSIRAGSCKNFKNIEDIPRAIKEALKDSNITTISEKKSKDYKEALKKMKEAESV